MSPRPQRSERTHRWCGWMIPAALLALTPKCALCLFAYAGLGTLLGLGGPELCGETNRAVPHWMLAAGLVAVGLGAVFIKSLLHARRHVQPVETM